MLLTITRPDDWHLHVRDDAALASTIPPTAARFARAIIMPNLKPPVTTTALALGYRKRIMANVPKGLEFEPLMTLYLTDNTPPSEIDTATASGLVHGVKLYPAGATTHSSAGVTDMRKVYPVLERMEKQGLPLLIHGEVTASQVDIFERETVFLEQELAPLIAKFPALRIVLEHITTQAAVDFICNAPKSVAATITAHHLLLNRNNMLAGGIRPHYYCLPILKRERDRQALVAAATSGNPKFFLGTDSAPHRRDTKETACGCAGVFSAPASIELYAEIFDENGALDKLEGFASFYGADFYRLPRNSSKITLSKQTWTLPETYPYDGGEIVPFYAGRPIAWRLGKVNN